MATFLILLFLLVVAYAIASAKQVPTNTVYLLTLFDKRLDIGVGEGLTVIPRWLMRHMGLSTLERRLDVLTKSRAYTRPDDSAATHEQPHQSEETITVPDGNGDGAVFIHVSNVSVQYRLMPLSKEWPAGWMKFMGIFGWRKAGAIREFTSIAQDEIEERILNATLEILRQVLPNYPYQLIIRLNVKMDGKLVDQAERTRVRKEIDALILDELNSYLAQWGLVSPRVPKGDIDPDPKIIESLQALSAANLDRDRQIVEMSATTAKVDMMFKATNTTPTLEQWMQAYGLQVALDNQGRAADHGLLASKLFESLKGILSPTVTFTNPPPTPPANPVAA